MLIGKKREKMKKKLLMCLCMILATCVLMAGCGMAGDDAVKSSSSSVNDANGGVKNSSAPLGSKENPFKLGVSPMSGWYAWYGVKGTGIFEKNGVNVEIKFFPVYSDSLTAFYSNQLDGICIAASDAVAPTNSNINFKMVLVNDNSYGADGLIVHEGINSVKELKGKTVATELGTLEHMFLLKILEDNGMTINDVNFVNMTINDAGPAFIAGKVDAAVLWEPTLSMAMQGGGKLLYSTKQTPGLIPDTLAIHNDIIASDPKLVQGIVNSWFDGVTMLQANDPKFMKAIYDGAEISADDYAIMLDGVTIFDKAKNQATFKEGNNYTSLPYTLQKSAEFLKSVGMIDKIPDNLKSLLEDQFIKNAK
jgi:NitT/TauT family transport system substrate-binding protein